MAVSAASTFRFGISPCHVVRLFWSTQPTSSDHYIFCLIPLQQQTPTRVRKLWQALLETLAQIHNVDYLSVGLEKFGRAGGYFTRQVKSLSKVSAAQLSAAPDKVPAIPHFDEIATVLRDSQPADSISICHGDFKVCNA
jgi:aminoglycoside phosphotransferase (APT) family kinase protein